MCQQSCPFFGGCLELAANCWTAKGLQKLKDYENLFFPAAAVAATAAAAVAVAAAAAQHSSASPLG